MAKEAGMLYASIGLVTDYDCFKESEIVSVNQVMENFNKYKLKLTELMINVITQISKEDWTKTLEELKVKH